MNEIEYQKKVVENYPDRLSSQTERLTHAGMGLAGETGELVDLLKKVAIYRVPAGGTLNKITHLVEKMDVLPGGPYARDDGDPAVVNVTVNGTFTGSATGWTVNTGWAYGSNAMAHSSAAANSIAQAWTYSAGTWRWGVDITAQSAAGTGIFPRHGGTGAVDGAPQSGIGTHFWSLTPVATNTFETIVASTWVGTIDNVVLFKQTATSAPQGNWDYYLDPLNGSGVAGPTSGPFPATII